MSSEHTRSDFFSSHSVLLAKPIQVVAPYVWAVGRGRHGLLVHYLRAVTMMCFRVGVLLPIPVAQRVLAQKFVADCSRLLYIAL